MSVLLCGAGDCAEGLRLNGEPWRVDCSVVDDAFVSEQQIATGPAEYPQAHALVGPPQMRCLLS